MADNTKIEWTDATWNPITGCSVVSPGCTNCYAMKLAGGRLQHHPTRQGLTVQSKAGSVWNGEVRFNEVALTQPLRWSRPRRIFVCAHGDLFHESVPNAWIDKAFAVMALAQQHTYQVLTKRSARMRAYMTDPATPGRIGRVLVDHCLIDKAWKFDADTWPVISIGDIDFPDDITVQLPLPNVWLGVSAEDQARADERIPDLLATPAAVRFLSAEPLLGPIDLTGLDITGDATIDALNGMSAADHWRTMWAPEITGTTLEEAIEGFEDWGFSYPPSDIKASVLDWVIAGGESGPGARPMHPGWARALRDQCAAADVPFFFKQWGAWLASTSAGITECYGSGPPDVAWPDGQIAFGTEEQHGGPAYLLRHVGKAAAGRLLDGVTHDAMPQAVP